MYVSVIAVLRDLSLTMSVKFTWCQKPAGYQRSKATLQASEDASHDDRLNNFGAEARTDPIVSGESRDLFCCNRLTSKHHSKSHSPFVQLGFL